MDAPGICDNCGRLIGDTETGYRLNVEIMADPGPVIELGESGNAETIRRDLEDQIRRMESMSAQEVSEAEDEVYEAYQFLLCTECRRDLHRRMKNKTRILSPET